MGTGGWQAGTLGERSSTKKHDLSAGKMKFSMTSSAKSHKIFLSVLT
jgi:hypothetical protein